MMTNSSSEIKGVERKNSFLIKGMAAIFGHRSFWLIFSEKHGINNYTLIVTRVDKYLTIIPRAEMGSGPHGLLTQRP